MNSVLLHHVRDAPQALNLRFQWFSQKMVFTKFFSFFVRFFGFFSFVFVSVSFFRFFSIRNGPKRCENDPKPSANDPKPSENDPKPSENDPKSSKERNTFTDEAESTQKIRPRPVWPS